MDKKMLTQKLNEISWQEHVNFEISEKYPDDREQSLRDAEEIEAMLRDLASQISPNTLDMLEQTDGIEWSLRLSPYVVEDDSVARAKKYLHHERYEIRFWAKRLLKNS